MALPVPGSVAKPKNIVILIGRNQDDDEQRPSEVEVLDTDEVVLHVRLDADHQKRVDARPVGQHGEQRRHGQKEHSMFPLTHVHERLKACEG